MEIWGLTGTLGSGKTTARQFLESKGYPTTDADMASRQIWDKSYPERDKIARQMTTRFGAEAFHPDGSLNRGFVRKKLVGSTENRIWLEALTHPHIVKRLA